LRHSQFQKSESETEIQKWELIMEAQQTTRTTNANRWALGVNGGAVGQSGVK